MTRVAGVLDHFLGLPLTPPGIEVLDGRKLGPSDVLGRTYYPLVPRRPSSCHTRQRYNHGAAVEPFEDLRTHAKSFQSSFQSPEGE